MQVTIPFGDGSVTATLPDDAQTIPNVPTRRLTAVPDLEAEVERALANPLGLPPIGDLVRPGARVTIAFDDATVLMFGPMRQVAIDVALRQLEAAGVRRRDVTLICANALHRKARPEELMFMLGTDLCSEFGERLFCHDAEDAERLVYLGKTPAGHDVEISRSVAESDLTIYITASHNRGFHGGWKSVCVGLSTWRSIRHHHTPDGMTMSLRNNRMHDMLNEMGKVVEAKIPGKVFKIDAIPANFLEVGRVVAGGVTETREACLETMESLYPPRRDLSDEKFDVIVYGVPNMSPYSVFTHMNPMLTLISSGLGYLGGTTEALGAPGCSLIMVTPCPNEWDRVHHAPYPHVWENVLSQTTDPYEIEKTYTEVYARHEEFIHKYRYEFAFHPLHPIMGTHPLKRLRHIGKVYVAGIREPALATHLGFTPTDSVETALALARARHGAGCRIAYVEQPVAPTKLAM